MPISTKLTISPALSERCSPPLRRSHAPLSSPPFLVYFFSPTCLFTAPTLPSFLLNFTALQRQGHLSGLAPIPQHQRVPGCQPKPGSFPVIPSCQLTGTQIFLSCVPWLYSSLHPPARADPLGMHSGVPLAPLPSHSQDCHKSARNWQILHRFQGRREKPAVYLGPSRPVRAEVAKEALCHVPPLGWRFERQVSVFGTKSELPAYDLSCLLIEVYSSNYSSSKRENNPSLEG